MSEGNDTGPIRCSLGIIAYNEEANIGCLLEAVMSQRMTVAVLAEIIVVASGCTDGTEAIVRSWIERDPRVRLLIQARREGKASAVNWFLSDAREKILLICAADVLPADVRHQLRPLSSATGLHLRGLLAFARGIDRRLRSMDSKGGAVPATSRAHRCSAKARG